MVRTLTQDSQDGGLRMGDVATKLHYSDESLIPSDAVKKQCL